MMKTKARFLPLLLCLLVAFPAFAENDATYYYQSDSLHARLHIAPAWEPLAIETTYIFPVETDGTCIFYYSPEQLSLETPLPELSAHLLETGIPLAGIAREGHIPQGLSSRSLSEGESGLFAVWSAVNASSLPDAATVDTLEAVISSYRDTDAYIEILPKADGFGVFTASDLSGATQTEAIFSQASLSLVNIWATYCQPCLAEMPDLGALAEEYAGKGVQIIGIPSDIFDAHGHVDADQLDLAQEIVDITSASYTHLIAGHDLQESILSQVMYVPTTYFVDKDGNILGEAYVGMRSKADWQQLIEEHLLAAGS